MNVKLLPIALFVTSLFSSLLIGAADGTESPLNVELWGDEITVRSGEKLRMKMTVENLSPEVVHVTTIRSTVEYTTLGGVVVNRKTVDWERDIYPFEVCEGAYTADLPLYTLPGTYTITLWVTYEGGETEEVQLTLRYRNFYICIGAAILLNSFVLYGRKIYMDRKKS